MSCLDWQKTYPYRESQISKSNEDVLHGCYYIQECHQNKQPKTYQSKNITLLSWRVGGANSTTGFYTRETSHK